MDKSYIVSGMMFGDEGKGSVTDYFAANSNVKYNVRHNGGSQALHSVKNGSISHRFSQLGSAFMNEGVETYLSSNTIVNPFNLISEASFYSKEANCSIKEIMKRVFIDREAKVVTPYHSLIRKVNELSSFEIRGTTGSGISEVQKVFDEIGICLSMTDLLKMDSETIDKIHQLQKYTSFIFESKINLIEKDVLKSNIDKEDIENLTTDYNKDYIVNCYTNLMGSNLINISTFNNIYDGGSIVFEGSQGVMIDKDYGIKPHVTGCDTTNRFAYELSEYIKIHPISIGCIPVYTSRHGAGPLPTNSSYLNTLIFDKNQVKSYFQGVPRYGWLDLVILRYSLNINKVDELFLTMLDRYSGINNIKVCNSYKYTGEIDDDFCKSFDYYIDGGEVIIKDIISNNNLKYYLSYIEPVYEDLKGYSFDNNVIRSVNDFPDEVFKYINYIEDKMKKKIKYLSYGPDRMQKIRM